MKRSVALLLFVVSVSGLGLGLAKDDVESCTDGDTTTRTAVDHYDFAVIGGGPIGLATANKLKDINPGKSVAVFEQYNFFNQAGSSNDAARFFRTMYTVRTCKQANKHTEKDKTKGTSI